jgi:leader peptidase (prepilin peptidase)/N-methyltransferase
MVIYFLIFVFGLAVGSFLNCVIYRLETNKNFLSGRSHCPKCQHQLNWQDLVPVVSFFILKRKCRYCKESISLQYPLVEIAIAILFILIFYYQYSLLACSLFSILCFVKTCYLLTLFCFLAIIFIYDLKHYIILDKVIYLAILVSGIWYFASGIFFKFDTGYETLNTIYSASGAAFFFFLIVLISKGKWMGVGDIKLAFLMGLILGFPNILVALFLAFFLGAIIGIGLILSGKKTLKSEVPFGPFLITGTFTAFFFGSEILNWYLKFFT